MNRPPMRNRVTPMGDVVAINLRGAWTGNRGALHVGTDIVRFHRGSLWIICALTFKDWKLVQWAPKRFTLLFFHDEAVALAAGHRPCALCRREAYERYRQSWAVAQGEGVLPSAGAIDHQLHDERIIRGTHRRRLHQREWSQVPWGAFVTTERGPALVLNDVIVPWSAEGYLAPRPRPWSGSVDVITPPSTLGALSAGYRPHIDSGAFESGR